MPVERCFDWESLALAELAAGNVAAASAMPAAPRRRPRALGSAVALRARRALRAPRCCSRAATPAGRPARRRASVARCAAAGARLQAAFAQLCWAARCRRRRPRGGDRGAAQGRAELDACGSLRVRDQTRRELRRLGGARETRGRGSGRRDGGLASLTARELEIAALVTDRKTNREIAATLFLSDKTIESHMRNIFNKLGVSSRVDVAQRDRARSTRARAPP